MVCQQLDQLEWDFIQARTESQDIDSLEWTDREFPPWAGWPVRLASWWLPVPDNTER